MIAPDTVVRNNLEYHLIEIKYWRVLLQQVITFDPEGLRP